MGEHEQDEALAAAKERVRVWRQELSARQVLGIIAVLKAGYRLSLRTGDTATEGALCQTMVLVLQHQVLPLALQQRQVDEAKAKQAAAMAARQGSDNADGSGGADGNPGSNTSRSTSSRPASGIVKKVVGQENVAAGLPAGARIAALIGAHLKITPPAPAPAVAAEISAAEEGETEGAVEAGEVGVEDGENEEGEAEEELPLEGGVEDLYSELQSAIKAEEFRIMHATVAMGGGEPTKDALAAAANQPMAQVEDAITRVTKIMLEACEGAGLAPVAVGALEMLSLKAEAGHILQQRIEAYAMRGRALASWSNQDTGGRQNVVHFLPLPAGSIEAEAAASAAAATAAKKPGAEAANAGTKESEDEIYPIVIEGAFE